MIIQEDEKVDNLTSQLFKLADEKIKLYYEGKKWLVDLLALEKNFSKYSENISKLNTDENLFLSGLIKLEELEKNKTINDSIDYVDSQILKKIVELGKLPENISLTFYDNFLCINETPTNIKEFNLCCLYNGFLNFVTHEKAVEKTAKFVVKKINNLYN